jgi:hydrogenase nickel incorporation protein HypA/HybF
MHEFSTAVGIVGTVTDVAKEHNAKRIKKIELVIGEFSMLNFDQLQFAFEIASEGTLAEDAELIMIKQKGEIHCQECEFQGPIEQPIQEQDHFAVTLANIFECPKCHSNKTKISGGRDIYVKNIEVEIDEETAEE